MDSAARRTADVIVIGAGFSGLLLIRKLRDELGLDVQAYERGSDVGGTWYWNRYPGARCDVESMFYCFSVDSELQQEWDWSERFPGQPELLNYFNHVADRWDSRRSIAFDTTISSARWSDETHEWTVVTDRGDTATARYLVSAVGCLSAATLPAFPGAEDFAGPIYHTGQWPQGGVDFAGLRVGVIGTGSSGVQAIPMIAQQAAHLTVFQRTAHYSVPARNRPLTDVERHATKREYDLLRSIARSSSKTGLPSENQPLGPAAVVDDALLHAELERRWWLGISLTNTLADSFISLEANERIAQWVRAKIRQIVDDPTTADLLASSNYPIGTKRIIYGTDFFETFNRPNVDLVSVVATPIEQFTTNGIVVDGREHEFDAIVCATGYDAITGALERIELRGRDGRLLSDVWAEGPKTYLGLAVHGFPNLFTVTGPGSPSVLSNMVVSIEQHVEWIVDYIERLRIDGIAWTEPEVDAQEAWVSHVNELANATLFPTAASWYMGANVPGKPRVFLPYLGGISAYRQKCDDVRADSYRGFAHGSGKEGQRSLQGTTA
ncbi:MAG: hypothetical protein QOH68_4096 [Nocardioidaceae bacterium]|nr:hypothetical protein [Nocardioidaceae bacterium]